MPGQIELHVSDWVSQGNPITSGLFDPYTILAKPPGRRVLVIAPHQDDEVIGCGGSIIKHTDAGDRVALLYLTDGRNGRQRRQALAEAIRTRQAEGVAGCHVLGIAESDIEFTTGVSDRQTAFQPVWVERLTELIKRHQPDLIYLPHVLEQHPDHFWANIALVTALEQLAAVPEQLHICAYEIWTPQRRNVFVNITEEIDRKQQAMAAHVSQLKLMDYHGLTEGLARYRGAQHPFPWITHAEGFMLLSAERYLRFVHGWVDSLARLHGRDLHEN